MSFSSQTIITWGSRSVVVDAAVPVNDVRESFADVDQNRGEQGKALGEQQRHD